MDEIYSRFSPLKRTSFTNNYVTCKAAAKPYRPGSRQVSVKSIIHEEVEIMHKIEGSPSPMPEQFDKSQLSSFKITLDKPSPEKKQTEESQMSFSPAKTKVWEDRPSAPSQLKKNQSNEILGR